MSVESHYRKDMGGSQQPSDSISYLFISFFRIWGSWAAVVASTVAEVNSRNNFDYII